MPAPAPLAATGVDLSPQNLEETRQALDLVEDDEPVTVQVQVAAGVREAGGVEGVLEIEVEAVRYVSRQFPGEGGLADLAGSEENDRREVRQVAADQFLVSSGDHAC